jgi:nucleotide-binding universal stress UspA family protein
MVRKILVGLGGTPFTDVAVRRAVELARLHGAEVTGITVLDEKKLEKVGPVPAGAAAYAQRMRDQRLQVTLERVEEAAGRLETQCGEQGTACSLEKEKGDPFSLMIDYARYHDLIVFGLKSLFDYGLTPEPEDALIRLVTQGVRPILAVSPVYRTVRRALVAYSGSMESAKAMRRFVQMRLWPDVELEVVHFSDEKEKAQKLLDDAARYCRAHDYRVKTRWIDDEAKTAVLSHAQSSDADILVMGNSVRSLLMRKILGDTVLHTVRNADRPLFLSQ